MKRSFFFLLMLLWINLGLIQAQDTTNVYKESEETTDCGGVERWDEKVLTDVDAPLVNYTPILTTLDSLVHIVTPPTSTTAPRFVGLEFYTYKFRCHITMKKYEADNDFHLVVSDGVNTMVTEIPDPICSVASTSAYVNEYIAARQFVSTYIPLTPDNNVNIPDVALTGVAFLDPPHGQTGAAPNHLEIHPILDLHFWTWADSTGSGVLVNNLPEPLLKVNFSPNVFSTETLLSIQTKNPILGKCKLELFGYDGKKAKQMDLPAATNNQIQYSLHKDNLAPGMYIYRIMNNGNWLYDGKLVIK